jgi:cyclopropane-fatty-acyl-phospholipid synthase
MYLNEQAQAAWPRHRSAAGRAWLIRRARICMRTADDHPALGRQDRSCRALPGPHGVIELRNGTTFRRLLTRGDVGFAEGYIAGEWTSPDLPQLIALAAQNVARLDRTLEGFWPVRMWRKLSHSCIAIRRRQPPQHRLPLRSGQ